MGRGWGGAAFAEAGALVFIKVVGVERSRLSAASSQADSWSAGRGGAAEEMERSMAGRGRWRWRWRCWRNAREAPERHAHGHGRPARDEGRVLIGARRDCSVKADGMRWRWRRRRRWRWRWQRKKSPGGPGARATLRAERARIYKCELSIKKFSTSSAIRVFLHCSQWSQFAFARHWRRRCGRRPLDGRPARCTSACTGPPRDAPLHCRIPRCLVRRPRRPRRPRQMRWAGLRARGSRPSC